MNRLANIPLQHSRLSQTRLPSAWAAGHKGGLSPETLPLFPSYQTFPSCLAFKRHYHLVIEGTLDIELSNPMIEEASEIFAALGDASRLRILRSLVDAGTPLSQGAIAEAADLSQANASKHLACLARVGLVMREPQGNNVFFRPVLPLVEDLCGIVCDHVSEQVRSSYNALS